MSLNWRGLQRKTILRISWTKCATWITGTSRSSPQLRSYLYRYKKHGGSWNDYERKFVNLMAERRIEEKLEPEMLHDACLLCSEDKPHHCHRRLVAEYLKNRWGNVDIEHLG